MKNRKFVVVAFLLVAAMVLGVGYANLVDSLEVDGTTTITKDQATTVFDGDVFFTNAEALPKDGSTTTTNTTSINADNNDKVSFTVHELAAAGDTATFRYEITNTSEFEVDLAVLLTANTTTVTDDNNVTKTAAQSYFTVEYSLDTNTIEAAQGSTPGVAYLTVTVTLNESIQYYTKGSFTLTITATSVPETVTSAE